jgi:hypothetical protein
MPSAATWTTGDHGASHSHKAGETLNIHNALERLHNFSMPWESYVPAGIVVLEVVAALFLVAGVRRRWRHWPGCTAIPCRGNPVYRQFVESWYWRFWPPSSWLRALGGDGVIGSLALGLLPISLPSVSESSRCTMWFLFFFVFYFLIPFPLY